MISNFDWYNDNSFKYFPLSEKASLKSDTTELPISTFVDGVIYTFDREVFISSIHYQGNIFYINLSDGSISEVPRISLIPYEKAKFYYKENNRGFLIFGEGIVIAKDIFADKEYVFENCRLEDKVLIHLPKIVNTIAIKDANYIGDIKIIGKNGVQTTKVNNGIMFSAIYEKPECTPMREGCVKSISNINPDSNGNLIIEGRNIIKIAPAKNGITAETALNPELLCITIFDRCQYCDSDIECDIVDSGAPGPPGPRGPSGPIGDCLALADWCCCCEKCDTAESCILCEICNLCEVCNICECCDACEFTDTCFSECNFCECDSELCPVNLDSPDCETCDLPGFGGYEEVCSIERAVVVKDPTTIWYYPKNFWAENSPLKEYYYIKYYDYAINEAHSLIELIANPPEGEQPPDRNQWGQYVGENDVVVYRYSNISVHKYTKEGVWLGQENNFTFYAMLDRTTKTWGYDGQIWGDFIARLDDYRYADGEFGWMPNAAKLPRPKYQTFSFLTPHANTQDHFKYYCDNAGRAMYIYGTWLFDGSKNQYYRAVVVMYEDGSYDEANQYDGADYPNQTPRCCILNTTTMKRTNEFPCMVFPLEIEVEKNDTTPGWTGISHYKNYAEAMFSLHQFDVFAAIPFSLSGSEQWIDDANNLTTKFTSYTPLVGFNRELDYSHNESDVMVFDKINFNDRLYWDYTCPLCDICDGESCVSCDLDMCYYCDSCEHCDSCDGGDCGGCDFCDLCDCDQCDTDGEACRLCEACDRCDNCDCDMCDHGCEDCDSCNSCDECDCDACDGGCDWCDCCNAACDNCDCDSCEHCDFCDGCDLCEVCNFCEAGDACCETCDSCEGDNP